MAAFRQDAVKIKKVLPDGTVQHDTIHRHVWNDDRQTYQKKGWVLDAPEPEGVEKKAKKEKA